MSMWAHYLIGLIVDDYPFLIDRVIGIHLALNKHYNIINRLVKKELACIKLAPERSIFLK
jgi:hypothetical protein